MRPGCLGSSRIVCRHIPPAPGCHWAAEGWVRRPVSSSRLPAVGRAEHRRVLNARVDGVWIPQRRLEVPDARELERALRAVVPEMIADGPLVREFVAHRL